MSAVVCFLVICAIIYGGITWLLPKLFGWFLNHKFKIKVRFGRISFPFCLRDVEVCKNGFSVHIDEIGIRSSFFNSEVSKFLSINIRDIRINKDIVAKTGNAFSHPAVYSAPVDFRNKKVPTSIINFAQFMAIHVYNISLVLMNNDLDAGWLLHAIASEMHLDGSIVHNSKTLIVTASLCDAQAKILRHFPTRKPSMETHSKVKPCLAEFNFGVALEGILIAQGPISVENLQVTVSNTKTTLHDGLYDFLRDARRNPPPKPTKSTTPVEKDGQKAYDCISPIIPKSFTLKIEDTTISSVRENSSNDFSAQLQAFTVSGKFSRKNPQMEFNLPTLYMGLHMQSFEIDTNHEKILFVDKLTMDSKLENDTVNLYLKLTTFQVIYNHPEIYGWLNSNFLQAMKSNPAILKVKSRPDVVKSAGKSSLEGFLKKVVIKGCAELWNVTCLGKLSGGQSATININHAKLLLEQFDEIRSCVYENRLANLLLENRHWSTELMVEALWWSLGNTGKEFNKKKVHTKGSPFYMGVSLIKISSYGNATKLDLSVHTLRLEWSSLLIEFIAQTLSCIEQYKMPKFEDKSLKRHRVKENNGSILVNAKVTDINLFFFNSYEACVLINLTEASLARSLQLTVLKLSGLQMAFRNEVAAIGLTLSDFPDIFSSIKLIRVEYQPQSKIPEVPQVTVHVANNTETMWNSLLHMHIFTLCQEMKAFYTTLRIKEEHPVEKEEKPQSEQKVKLIFDLYAEGSSMLGIKISKRHSMQIFLENLYLSRTDRWVISLENIFVNLDEQHIFTFKDVNVRLLREVDLLTAERTHYENFVLPSNRVWVTSIRRFSGTFPYDYNFSDAIQNEFVSLFKWLKVIHNIKKKPFTVNSPLPCDMLIQVKEFLLEMSDDPFEVKLRENYVLLVDEYNESIERRELLEQKIAQMCQERPLMPARTIESMRAMLEKKNSEIYIQRSKKIAEAGPPRTRLIAWIMSDLEIMAMADPSIHGTENVTRMMRDIDSDSPWPEEGLEFITLWCRAVNMSCSEWKFMLRDFPQPMFAVKQMRLFGHLCGAEQVAPRRAKRDVQIEIGEPFGTHTIQRGMPALKFYHDFDCELDQCSYAFGPCWEPVMAQCNLSFEKISAPSRDPSPLLPFWDKLRLLLHGRLTMIVRQFTVLLHASLDPYNTTEEMELTWNNCGIVWTNAKVMFKGELNISVRTASRYDDCRLLHFPNLKLTFKLHWICLANPNDHHSVIPCAPDKLPEYSSNQVHDSFRAFRSQNLNIWISFETRAVPGQQPEIDIPNLVLYGSTLRWFENLKLILSGVTRPTRRGPVFNNVRPRKKQLSRHYRKAHLQMSLHKFQVLYWISHALNRGFELNGGRVSFSSEHTLTLYPIDDGLIHRPRADWSTMYMNCELNDTEIWLKSILNERPDASSESLVNTENPKIVKFYFLSVARVSYGRETMLTTTGATSEQRHKDSPTHKLVVYDLKGAWTKNNRDVAFTLFDSFMKNQKLKKNLSTEVLKGFRKDGGSTTTPLKTRRTDNNIASVSAGSSILGAGTPTSGLNKTQQTSHAITMLQQLIAEADHKFHVYSDDLSTQTKEQQLQGLQACQDSDVTHYNWFISLVNSQVLLKGCETSGYVILSAAKTEILQRVHRPVWRDRSLVSKTTWVGSLECMQYYATVSPGENDSLLDENIMWLTVDNIQEKDREATVINELPDIPHLVGSGQSVGGVVSETVGASGPPGLEGVHPIQLQRIVSRCKCEFFYVSYGDTSIDPGTLTEVPPIPAEESMSPWERQDEPVDAFTLMHHDLDVCTNSLQYAMILDIVNNLMLFVEPQRKQASEKLARMRFQLQLSSGEDQKRPILHLQTQVRNLMCQLRFFEKEIHLIGKARTEQRDSEELRKEYEEVHSQIQECKDKLNVKSEELDMIISCYKETQLSAMNKLATIRNDKPLIIVRANEICFKHAQWRLTEADGQIGIADLILSNFLYTKKSKSDDSVEHLLELGYIRMSNLIPRETFEDVLCPTELQRDMPVDHKRVLRVFCREKQPVGGISVKEHFEINVVPITIAITKKFYSTMLKFCFPDRDTSEADADDIDDAASTTSGSTTSLRSSKRASKSKKSNKDSEFYVKIVKDDVEKMKERAEKNKLFIYIKIPEVPVRVSYKGNKEKNFEDITDFSLVIPTLEYHNVTWTWLDLLLAMKTDSRRVILSQAIKQKLQIRHKPLSSIGERASPQEEDKAKMLFGSRHAIENRSQRKGVFKFNKS
uniref:FMP27/BLTP2/Hobbit GFWDK motif-containing RBG unit domain-containing protein n=1 Tax=Phlebotomus kandelakii TaxID=1109342 RepID=A0A6B2EIM8_9DIPT